MDDLDRTLARSLREAFLSKGVPAVLYPPLHVGRDRTPFTPDLMIEHGGRTIIIEIALAEPTDIETKKRQLVRYAQSVPTAGAFLFANRNGHAVIASLRPDGTWHEVSADENNVGHAGDSAGRVLEMIGA